MPSPQNEASHRLLGGVRAGDAVLARLLAAAPEALTNILQAVAARRTWSGGSQCIKDSAMQAVGRQLWAVSRGAAAGCRAEYSSLRS